MSREEIVLTTCPRDCYDGCGIAVVKREGRIHRVIGDRTHPISRGSLCGKCALAYNGVWRDPEARLDTPLLRSGPKGSGRFEPIGWDEALGLTAEKLTSAIDRHGAGSILNTHYTGTCSTIAGEFPMRFFNRLGATEVTPDTICNNAGHVALNYVLGSSLTGFDPETRSDSRCIMVWGANPSASAPHIHKHWLGESDASVVVIDPVRHATAVNADIYLQPFPGSDAVLAFALMNVMVRDGLTDPTFIENHTVGWSELEPLVTQSEPGWAAEVTGITGRADRTGCTSVRRRPIFALAGTRSAATTAWRQCHACLRDVASHHRQYRQARRRDLLSERRRSPEFRRRLRCGASSEKGTDALHQPHGLGGRSRRPESFPRTHLMEYERGRFRAAPGAVAPVSATRRSLQPWSLICFRPTPRILPTSYCPAASFLEFDDLTLPYFRLLVAAQVKAAEAPGQALPNQEIFRRLAKAMGYTEPELYEKDESIINYLLDNPV